MYQTFRPFRLQPPVAVPGPWFGFNPERTARSADRIPIETIASFGLHHPLEVGHDNRPNRVRHPADQSFTSNCSPPPLARTQLLLVTKLKPNFDKDFHLADSVHTQAHSGWAFGPNALGPFSAE